eukprot:6948372-Pyramimonas_sp.AAC.1
MKRVKDALPVGPRTLFWAQEPRASFATGTFVLLGPQSVVIGAGTACEFRYWDPRWSSLWGHEALHWAQEPRASSATGTLGGAPHGATKR